MEISHFLSSAKRITMPPRTEEEYQDTSVTGVPAEMLDAVRDIAKQQSRKEGRKVYPRDIFTQAIETLISDLGQGKHIQWPATRPMTGGKPYHVRLEVGVLESMRQTCDEHNVRKNIFFLGALDRHLKKEGYTIPL